MSRRGNGSASPSPSVTHSRQPDMSVFSHFRTSVRNVAGRSTVERELDAELESYIDLLTAEYIKAGATPEEARRAALIKVGGVEHVKDQVRDERPGMMFENGLRDLRYG